MLSVRVDQGERPLVIIEQGCVRQRGERLHEHLVEVLRCSAVPALVEQNEILPQIDVSRLVSFELPQEKQIAKDQHAEEPEEVPIAPQKVHVQFYRGGAARTAK